MTASYTAFPLPDNTHFREMSRAEAKKVVQQIEAMIPSRLELLSTVVRYELPTWRADLSRSSLPQLGVWLDRHSEGRQLSSRERESVLRQLGDKWSFLLGDRLVMTPLSLSLGLDVSLYVAESIRSGRDWIRWRPGKPPKLSASYNKPVLGGFADDLEFSFMGFAQKCVLNAIRRRSDPHTLVPDGTLSQRIDAVIASVPTQEPRELLVLSYNAFTSAADAARPAT